MSDKLVDFYQGESKLWTVSFAFDITNDTIYFRMAKDLKQTSPDLEIMGVGLFPIGGEILGVSFALTPALSAGLEAGEYYAEHEIRSLTRVEIFLRQKIIVNYPVPRSI